MSRFVSATLWMLVIHTTSQAGEVTVRDAVVKLKHEVRLPASESGSITQVHVADGQLVGEGSLILTLDDAKLELEALAASRAAEVARLVSENDVDARFAEKSRAVAEAELQRAEQAVRLFAKSVSKSELDQLRLVVERATLAAEQAARDLHVATLRAELERARADVLAVRLENMKIRAPFDGLVVQLQKQAGEWLNLGEPIARVIRLDQLRVEGFVDGSQYDQSLCGQPATLAVTLPGGNQSTFSGKITFVSSELHPISGQVRVWAEVDNPTAELRPGMRGLMTIQN